MIRLSLLMGNYVRISSAIIILFLSGALSQDTIRFNTHQGIKDSLETILTENGDLNTSYTLSQFNENEVSYSLHTNLATLDTLLFKSTDILSEKIQSRHYNSIIGLTNVRDIDERFMRTLNQYRYLSGESELILGRTPNNKIGAIISTQTDFSSTVTGIAGFSRKSDETWDFAGEADIHLENSWKTAGIIDILWKRTGEESQLLKFGIEEPYLFGFPFGGKFGFIQDLRDGSFVKSNRAIQIILFTERLGRWDIGTSNTRIIPTPKGDSLGVNESKESSFIVSNQVYALNDRWLPTKGYRHEFDITGGTLKSTVTSSVLKFNGTVEIFYPFTSSVGSKFQSSLLGTIIEGQNIQEGDKVYFGGSTLLRGYPDDFFNDDWVFIQSMEFQYSQSNSRLFTFIDAGVAPIFDGAKLGYGFGYSQVSENTIVSITYGIGQENRLSQGKLHVIFTSRI